MKKEYMKPALKVVKIQHLQMLCGSPDAYDEYSGNPSYARRFDSWFDDEGE